MEKKKSSSLISDSNDLEIRTFLKNTYNGKIEVLDQSNFHQLKRPILVIFHQISKMCNEFQIWTDLLYELSSKYEDSVQLAVAQLEEVNLFHFDWQELDILGMDVDLPPFVFARDSDEHQFQLDPVVTKDSITQFCERLINGELFLSDPIPEDQPDDSNIRTVVATNFKQIVEESEKDVCITFHSNYSSMYDYYDNRQTPKYFKDDSDKLAFFKINASTNYIPPEYRIRVFPTTIFIPKNNKNNRKRLVHSRFVYNEYLKFVSRNLTEESKTFDRKGRRKI